MPATDLTLVSALAIAVAAEAGAITFLVLQWKKSNDGRVADKDVLIKIVKDNTESNTLLSKNLEINTEATKAATNATDRLYRDILIAMGVTKKKTK